MGIVGDPRSPEELYDVLTISFDLESMAVPFSHLWKPYVTKPTGKEEVMLLKVN